MTEVNIDAIAVHNWCGTGLAVLAMRTRWFGHVDEWTIPNKLAGRRIEAKGVKRKTGVTTDGGSEINSALHNHRRTPARPRHSDLPF